MPKSNYKIRINVTGKGYKCGYVSLSADAMNVFKSPYYSVKRMNDRLMFIPWNEKTERGIVSLGNNTLQFGLHTDCEKMKDFCGEYYLYSTNEKGAVWVKLEDRHPFEREYKDRDASKRDKVAVVGVDDLVPAAGETPQFVGLPTLKQLLGKKIEEGQAKLAEIKAEIDRLNKQYIEPLKEQAYEIDQELCAFCTAYNCLKDGE